MKIIKYVMKDKIITTDRIHQSDSEVLNYTLEKKGWKLMS